MPKTPDYFKGKTLVVTGGASGIGRATALVFGREGANVLCADINEQAAQQAARAVTEAGGRGEATFVDVKAKADEPVDRIEAVSQSVCGLPVATAVDDEDVEDAGEE